MLQNLIPELFDEINANGTILAAGARPLDHARALWIHEEALLIRVAARIWDCTGYFP